MKIQQVESLYTTLKKISEKELPFSLSYKIAKVLNQIETDYSFYIEKLKKIAEKYGEKDESGELVINDNGDIKILPEFKKIAEDEVKELNETDVLQLTIFFSPEELSNFDFKPSDIQALLPIIQEY